ncbi:DNA-binding protein [Amycolatopsis thailandensis]|uniref:DNA-binding protein n=1 Tax=Amycolatopsis thailandensis TaxID=589330 RepID=A0A229RGA3_9PSEU|nr:helix-turn-helix transcriptional regulator [Amycolatopsis thailandensis]OXM45677.1 DNA-binding protein [Amycolatopsis thailandensis]
MGTLTPTAIKRWIALEMKRLREAAGYDRATAAERIGKATTVIAHIETSRNLPAPADLEILLKFYGVPEKVPRFLDLIKRAKRGRDWWINFDYGVFDWFNLYLGLETGAARISIVDLVGLHGLFQTRDYALALMREGRRWDNQAELETMVDLRMARQGILDRPGDAPQIWSIVDEGVLRRQVGGPAVMSAQLRHLMDLSERSNIDIQVLPFTAGAHGASDGTFIIIDYPAEFSGDPGTVYVENRREGLYYEDKEDLRRFRNTFERLQAQADHPGRTRNFLQNLARELNEH